HGDVGARRVRGRRPARGDLLRPRRAGGGDPRAGGADRAPVPRSGRGVSAAPEARAAGVRFVGATRRYGDVVALDGLDLEVSAGELLVLVGPSGSGKSTALRALAGLERLDAGRVEIGGRDVTG